MNIGRSVAALALALGACDEELPPASPDAAQAAPIAPAEPARAESPSLGPCRAGWTAQFAFARAPYCLPTAYDIDVDCHTHPGTELFFDDAGPSCVTLGDPCTARFAERSGDALRFVDREAAAGGDGTRGAPYRTIAEAIRDAPAGTIVLVAAGTYQETLQLTTELAIVGACAGTTIISGGSDTRAAVGIDSAARVSIDNLTIESTTGPGITSRDSAVELRGVIVVARGTGLAVSGGSLRAELVDLRGTPATERFPGHALSADRAAIELTRVRTGLSDAAAIIVTGEGGTLRAHRVIVSPGYGDPEPRDGRGIVITRGATATITEVAVVGARTDGLLIADAASVDSEELLVTGTRFADTTIEARDVHVEGASRLDVRKLVVIGEAGGIAVLDDSDANIRDAVLRGRIHVRDLTSDTGIRVHDSRIQLARVALEGHQVAIAARHSEIEAVDVIVDIPRGSAWLLEDDAHLTATRIDVDRARTAAIQLTPGATIVLSDAYVRGTLPHPETGSFGRALELGGESATIERMRIEQSHDVALFANRGATTVRDIAIVDTASAPCVGDECFVPPGGFGIAATGGETRVERFSVEGSALCGVLVAEGDLDLRDGIVRANPIGACIQRDGYDYSRLEAGVSFTGNERNLDATRLPVPAPIH